MGPPLHIVTGAFGFTGRYIARRLLDEGLRVRTLTGHPGRADGFGGRVEVAPFDFDRPERLVEHLRGADVLYNTYWVRFPHGRATYEGAVRNTLALIRAAEEAEVRRLVHVSITNPSETSPFAYFRGKAELERAIGASRLSHAIIRPAVIYGDQGVLINNIAWLLRHFPVFAVPGSGAYRLQPIFVEDMARLAVAAGRRETDETFDAVGPDVFTFDGLVRMVASAVGSRARIVHLAPSLALLMARVIGFAVRDVILTRDEVDGLLADLLVSAGAPTGTTRLADWLRANAGSVGHRYESELALHYR